MRRLYFSAMVILMVVGAGQARADLVITLVETGGDVVVTSASAVVDLTGLENYDVLHVPTGFMYPEGGTLIQGPVSPTTFGRYAGATGPIMGPNSFGTGFVASASYGAGPVVGVNLEGTLIVLPAGYVSGSMLEESSNTYSGATFESLGITAGSYVWSWGEGGPNQTLTINAVAGEPIVVAPNSVSVTRGIYVFGDATSLTASDNTDLSLGRANTDTQSRTEFEVKSISPTATPTSFEFRLEGSVIARSNVVQSIELFDYTASAGSGDWELLDTRDATRSPVPDSAVIVSPMGDLSRFVQPGTNFIEARIRYKSDSNRQVFRSNTDQTVWMIQAH